MKKKAEAWCKASSTCVGFMHTTISHGGWHGKPQFCKSITHTDNAEWEYWLGRNETRFHVVGGKHPIIFLAKELAMVLS